MREKQRDFVVEQRIESEQGRRQEWYQFLCCVDSASTILEIHVTTSSCIIAGVVVALYHEFMSQLETRNTDKWKKIRMFQHVRG